MDLSGPGSNDSKVVTLDLPQLQNESFIIRCSLVSYLGHILKISSTFAFMTYKNKWFYTFTLVSYSKNLNVIMK